MPIMLVTPVAVKRRTHPTLHGARHDGLYNFNCTHTCAPPSGTRPWGTVHCTAAQVHPSGIAGHVGAAP